MEPKISLEQINIDKLNTMCTLTPMHGWHIRGTKSGSPYIANGEIKAEKFYLVKGKKFHPLEGVLF